MIQRKASKITDSFVNSAHEEHFNVSKAIRDDAPIVTTDSVIKSTNFEADSDEQAIETAKFLASEGQDYSDIGHVDLDLISVCRVDPEKEWEDIETIWF